MPKNKTHSGIKKRVKVTGSGKIMHAGSAKRHHLEQQVHPASPGARPVCTSLPPTMCRASSACSASDPSDRRPDESPPQPALPAAPEVGDRGA